MAKVEDWAILLTLPSIALAAYLTAWRSRNSTLKRVGSAIVAAIAGFVGYYATMAYALPGLENLRHRAISSNDILDEIVMFAICIVAVVIAIRHSRLAVRKNPKAVA